MKNPPLHVGARVQRVRPAAGASARYGRISHVSTDGVHVQVQWFTFQDVWTGCSFEKRQHLRLLLDPATS